MPIMPRGVVSQREIAEGVARVKGQLSPDVVELFHNIGEDWTGDPSLFFRVVLSDEASRPDRLRESTKRVFAAIHREINADEFGLQYYINFRSESEQAKLKRDAWAQ